MKICVVGGDGYCGWATALYMSRQGHTVRSSAASCVGSGISIEPHFLSESLLDSLMNIAVRYRDRVDRSLFMPRGNWRRTRNRREAALLEPALTGEAGLRINDDNARRSMTEKSACGWTFR